MTSYHIEISHNPYLAPGATEVHAIVKITSTVDSAVASAEAAEVILLDCSSSMNSPDTKIREARRAVETAIDCLRDGAWFAIIRGTDVTSVIYPPYGGLALASATSRAAAKAAVAEVGAEGGTAIGRWLLHARDVLASRPNAIHHAILLTDGRNEHETEQELSAALDACVTHFQCDCRGVGVDWEVGTLRTIADALLGTIAPPIRRPEDLAADFQTMIQRAMSLAGPVRLRIWRPRQATMRIFRQVHPQILDLTGAATVIDEQTEEYFLGAWGSEFRAYYLCLQLPEHDVGWSGLASRVGVIADGVIADGERLAGTEMPVTWTEDSSLFTAIDAEVAHYTGQEELSRAIQEGLAARDEGDAPTAERKLGRAAQHASNDDNEETLTRLAKVVVLIDPAAGVVQLRKHADRGDVMDLDADSTLTREPRK